MVKFQPINSGLERRAPNPWHKSSFYVVPMVFTNPQISWARAGNTPHKWIANDVIFTIYT